jgi:predicted dehydrogenase
MKNKARIAIIGAGWWACEYHIPDVLENKNAELVSVAGLGIKELDQIKRHFKIPHVTENHREVYSKKPDGVIVSSPHIFHFEHSMLALENDCHVLVEKPMVTQTKDALKINQMVEKKGKILMTPYGLNHTVYMEKAADHIKNGNIGEIKHILLHMSSALMDLFGGEPMLETENHFLRPSASTWSDPKLAGGYGWGQMTHALAAMFFVTGLEPLQIYAQSGKSPTGADYFDSAVLRFKQDATATISGAAGLPKHCPPQLELKVYGSEGMLLLDVEEGRERFEIRRFDKKDIIEPFGLGEGYGSYSTRESVNRFIEICLGNKVRNCGDHIVGLKTVQVLEAMYESISSEKTVKC